jgi:uncharacterized phage protein (TIGR01671 family)
MEIKKYRSWNEQDKCFYYFLNGGYFNVKGEVVKNWRFDWANAEQFTGLRDKNGKEIYDGDILKYENFHKGFYPKLNVREWDAICVIKWNTAECRFSITEIGHNEFMFCSNDWFCYSAEIIGNIHENPELYK